MITLPILLRWLVAIAVAGVACIAAMIGDARADATARAGAAAGRERRAEGARQRSDLMPIWQIKASGGRA